MRLASFAERCRLAWLSRASRQWTGPPESLCGGFWSRGAGPGPFSVSDTTHPVSSATAAIRATSDGRTASDRRMVSFMGRVLMRCFCRNHSDARFARNLHQDWLAPGGDADVAPIRMMDPNGPFPADCNDFGHDASCSYRPEQGLCQGDGNTKHAHIRTSRECVAIA